jgi:hypothetical protein
MIKHLLKMVKLQIIQGVLFGNKLYCPNNGSAYNIETGTAEYAPAMDNLPIFYITEVIYKY